MSGEATRATLSVAFDGDRWRIRAGEEELGSLAELFDFDEAFRLAVQRAQRLLAASGTRDAGHLGGPPGAWPIGRAAVERLHAIDASWRSGARSIDAVRDACRALAALALQVDDTLGVGDVVPGQAMAACALWRAHALSKEEPSGAPSRAPDAGAPAGEPELWEGLEEEALLAYALGYGRAAQARAALLPTGSAVRAAVLRDDAALRAAWRRRPRPPLANYLAEERIGALPEHSAREWRAGAAPGKQPSDAATAAQARRGATFSTAQTTAWRALAAAIDEPDRLHGRAHGVRANDGKADTLRSVARKLLDPEAAGRGASGPGQRRVLERLAQSLARIPPSVGPFLPSSVEAALYRAYAFSAIDGLADFALERFSSAELAEGLLAALGTPPDAHGRELVRWLEFRIAGHRQLAKKGDAVKALEELELLGLGGRSGFVDGVAKRADWMDPVLRRIAKLHAARGDTRPSHRHVLAFFARDYFLDLAEGERLTRVWASATASDWSALSVAKLDGDAAELLRLGRSERATSSIRFEAWEGLLEQGLVPADEAHEGMRALVTRRGEDGYTLQRYAKWLFARGEVRRARELVEDWLGLADESSDDAILRAAMRALVARSHRREGNVEEAWRVLQPALLVGSAEPITLAAQLAAQRGQRDVALRLARDLGERYPGTRSAMALATVHWGLGEDDEAARILGEASLSEADWYARLPQKFEEAVEGRNLDDTKRAFRALLGAKGFPPRLALRLANEFRVRSPERTFELLLVPRLSHPLQDLNRNLSAFRALRAWKGEAEAKAWLDQRVPKELRDPLSQFAFESDLDELLWTHASFPAEHGHFPNAVWMYRALATVRSRDEDPRHWETLRARFKADDPELSHLVGQVLVGQRPASTLLHVTEPSDQREAAYALAVKASADGHYEEAIRWFRVCVDLWVPGKDGEHAWAARALTRLKANAKSLARLSRLELEPKPQRLGSTDEEPTRTDSSATRRGRTPGSPRTRPATLSLHSRDSIRRSLRRNAQGTASAGHREGKVERSRLKRCRVLPLERRAA